MAARFSFVAGFSRLTTPLHTSDPPNLGAPKVRSKAPSISKQILIKLLAVAIGFLMFALTWVYDLLGTDVLAHFIATSHARSADNFGTIAGWRLLFYLFEYCYPVAVALTTTYVLWNGFPSERKRLLFYVPAFAAVGPLTMINFIQYDQLVDRKVQVFFNIVVIFISYVLLLNIQDLKPKSKDGIALRSLSIFFLASLGILLPAIYTIIFCLVIFGLLTPKAAKDIGDHTVISISGVVGAVVAVLDTIKKFRDA
jgi:hypothetical protein